MPGCEREDHFHDLDVAISVPALIFYGWHPPYQDNAISTMTPQVSFYILPDLLEDEQPQQVRNLFACRLAEKAWKNEVCSHIHLPSEVDVQAADALLWSFREDSFLPHCICDSSSSQQEPVTLGCTSQQLTGKSGLLINLGNEIPDNLDSFSRIAEIVVSDATTLELARTRFRQYREKGMTPKHQKIGKPA